MDQFWFVPVTVTFGEEVLLPQDGAAVSPQSELVVAGTRLRGVIAQLCRSRDPVWLEHLIVSGDVAAAPAFPDAGAGVIGRPVPRTALVAAHPDRDRVVDERLALDEEVAVRRLGGLATHRGRMWTPVMVRTRTTQRLVRPRTGGTVDGLGPMTFTPVSAQQVFTAQFRLRGERARCEQLAQMLRELLDQKTVALGSGKDGAYGGDAVFTVGADLHRTAEPVSVDDLAAGDEVDVVLRSPALVVSPAGHYLPDAVRTHLDELFARLDVPAVAVSASVGRVRAGGAHVGYGRMRPAPWAAAPGSVIRVRARGLIRARDWPQILGHRVGHRVVDGFGIVGVEPLDGRNGGFLEQHNTAERTSDGMVLVSSGPPVAPRTDPDWGQDRAGQQLTMLQEELFAAASARWRRGAVVDLAAAWGDTVPAAVWGRLRKVMHDPGLLASLVGELTKDKTHPLQRARVGNVFVGSWICAAATGDRAGAFTPLPDPLKLRWRNDLLMASLISPATKPVGTYMNAHLESELLTLVRDLVLLGQRGGQR